MTTGAPPLTSSSGVKARPICGAMPEQRHQRGGHPGAAHAFRVVVAGQRERLGRHEPDLREAAHLVPRVVIERRRLEIEDVVLGQRLPDEGEPRRIAIGQRAEEHGVDEREDGAVHADAERQRQHHERGERRPSRHRPPREPDIAPPQVQIHA